MLNPESGICYKKSIRYLFKKKTRILAQALQETLPKTWDFSNGPGLSDPGPTEDISVSSLLKRAEDILARAAFPWERPVSELRLGPDFTNDGYSQ